MSGYRKLSILFFLALALNLFGCGSNSTSFVAAGGQNVALPNQQQLTLNLGQLDPALTHFQLVAFNGNGIPLLTTGAIPVQPVVTGLIPNAQSIQLVFFTAPTNRSLPGGVRAQLVPFGEQGDNNVLNTLQRVSATNFDLLGRVDFTVLPADLSPIPEGLVDISGSPESILLTLPASSTADVIVTGTVGQTGVAVLGRLISAGSDSPAFRVAREGDRIVVIGEQAGRGNLVLTLGGFRATIPVEVVRGDQLELSPNQVNARLGDKIPELFQIRVVQSDGGQVLLSGDFAANLFKFDPPQILDQNGTAIAPGQGSVGLVSSQGEQLANAQVNVEDADRFVINPPSREIGINESTSIEVFALYDNTTTQIKVTDLSTVNLSIVSGAGKINLSNASKSAIGVESGVATVRANVAGRDSETADIIVGDNVVSYVAVRMEPSQLNLQPGQRQQLTVLADRAGGGSDNITAFALFEFSPPQVGSVSSTGLVEATQAGMAEVEACVAAAERNDGTFVVIDPSTRTNPPLDGPDIETTPEGELKRNGLVFKVTKRTEVEVEDPPASTSIVVADLATPGLNIFTSTGDVAPSTTLPFSETIIGMTADKSLDTFYAVSPSANNITAFSSFTAPTITVNSNLPTGSTPTGVSIDEATKRMIVNATGLSQFQVIDNATTLPANGIPIVPDRVIQTGVSYTGDIAFDGTNLFAANGNQIDIFANAATAMSPPIVAPSATLTVAGVTNIRGLSISGGSLFIAHDNGVSRVTVLDALLGGNNVPPETSIITGGNPFEVIVEDGRLIVTQGQEVRIYADAFTATGAVAPEVTISGPNTGFTAPGPIVGCP